MVVDLHVGPLNRIVVLRQIKSTTDRSHRTFRGTDYLFATNFVQATSSAIVKVTIMTFYEQHFSQRPYYKKNIVITGWRSR